MNAHIANLSHVLAPNVAAPTVAKTISNTAVTLANLGVAIDGNTRYVMLTVEAGPVRVCPEGTTPTTTLGQPVYAGQAVLLSRAEALTAKWIRSTAIDATAQVSQYTE